MRERKQRREPSAPKRRHLPNRLGKAIDYIRKALRWLREWCRTVVRRARAGDRIAIQVAAGAMIAVAGLAIGFFPVGWFALRKPTDLESGDAKKFERKVATYEEYWDVLGHRRYMAPPVPIEKKDGVASVSAQELAKQLRYLGAMGAGSQMRALISTKNSPPAFYASGEKVLEFTLKSLAAEKIVLTIADEDVEVYR